MFPFLLFLALTKEEIPFKFKYLTDKAIEKSKTKIPKEERYEKSLPGYYSFPNVNFVLKNTLVSHKSTDIKGFAIEDEYLAIVKRKSFNLDNNFTFIDSSNQRFYEVKDIILSDDQINIYSTSEKTIFDVMTNFNYHSKTTKDYFPQIHVNWEKQTRNPILHQIKLTDSRASIGCRGTFSIDLAVSFKSLSDIYIRATFGIDVTVSSEIELNDGSFEQLNELTLFETETINLEEFEYKFEFRGIEFEIKPSIKGEGKIINNPFGEIEETIDIEKSYQITGTKTIEITNYATVDSKWKLQVSSGPESAALGDQSYLPEKAEFRITPELTFFYSIDIIYGKNKTTLDCGLIVPVEFNFQADLKKYLPPSFEGEIKSEISSFYNFDQMSIERQTTGNEKETVTIINKQSNEHFVKKVSTGKIYLKFTSMYKELTKNMFQNPSDEIYSLVEYKDLQWKTANSSYIQLYMSATDQTKSSKPSYSMSFPFMIYKTTPVSSNLRFLIDSNKFDFQTFFYILDYNIKFDPILFTPKIFKSDTVSNSFNINGATKYQDTSFEMTNFQGKISVWTCRPIKNNIFYDTSSDYFPIIKVKKSNIKYVVIYIDENDDMKIDDQAEFIPETNFSMTQLKGAFQYDHHYFYIYNYTYEGNSNLHCILMNVTLITEQNGVSSKKFLGFVFAGKSTYFKGSFGLEGGPYLHLKKEENPKFQLDIIYYTSTKIFHISKAKMKNTIKDYDQVVKDGFLDLSTDIFTLKYYVKERELPVVVKPSVTNCKYMVLSRRDYNIGIQGSIKLEFEKDEYYSFIRISSITNPIKDCFLYMRARNIILLSNDAKRVSDDVYYFYCRGDSLTIPIRRSNINSDECSIEYLLTDMDNPSDPYITSAGQEIIFDNQAKPKGFFIKTYNDKYFIFNNSKTNLVKYTMDIDENTKLLAFVNPYQRQDPVTFIPSFTVIEEGDLSVSADLRIIKQIAESSGLNQYDFYVISEWDKVTSIRIKDKRIEEKVVNGVAKFTVKFGESDSEEEEELSILSDDNEDELVFYSKCTDNTTANCELEYVPYDGYYQLVRFPNKEGLNTTGRGRFTAIIQASFLENYSYYKLYEGTFTSVRSYFKKEAVTLHIEDVYPYDNFIPNATRYMHNVNKKNETEEPEKPEEPEKTEELENTEVPERSEIPTATPTASKIVHNLKDAYRTFCLKDVSQNNLPFSNRYLNGNFTALKEILGIKEEVDETKLRIDDDDECIYVGLENLRFNLNNATSDIVDLRTGKTLLDIDDSKSDYEPIFVESNSNKENKVSNKKKMIFFIIVGAAAVVVIAVIVIIVVVVVKKRRPRREEDTQSIEQNMISDDNNDFDPYDQNQLKNNRKGRNKNEIDEEISEDDKYYNTLLG